MRRKPKPEDGQGETATARIISAWSTEVPAFEAAQYLEGTAKDTANTSVVSVQGAAAVQALGHQAVMAAWSRWTRPDPPGPGPPARDRIDMHRLVEPNATRIRRCPPVRRSPGNERPGSPGATRSSRNTNSTTTAMTGTVAKDALYDVVAHRRLLAPSSLIARAGAKEKRGS